MKKIILSLFILFPFLVFSQGFKAGIRAGIIGSQVDGDTYEGFNKAGLTGGLYVNHKLSDLFSLQLEMNYIQKGSRKPVDLNNTYYLMRLNYIEVPLLLQWHVSPSLDIFGGPSYSILMNSLEETELGTYQGPVFTKNEVAIRAGISYKLSEQWKVDGRYGDSISSIRPAPSGYSPYLIKGQTNRWLELGLSYDF